MKDKKGLVFAIEEFSVFDGNGIRSTVFLKGCPLKCSWCHNPEGQSFDIQIIKSPNGCTDCKNCIKAANAAGYSGLSYESIAACPQNLIRVSGEEYIVDSLTNILLKNKRIFDSTGGGVTFSGGEPLAQPDFLLNMLKALSGKLNRCVQTSGYAPPSVFSEVLKETDYFLYDLKVLNPKLSIEHTGADINVILGNFDLLIKSGKEFTVRIPLIPTVTDTKENINAIIELLNSYSITYAEGLPYNKMAGAKYQMCQREYKPQFDPEQQVYLPVDEFRKNGIELKIL